MVCRCVECGFRVNTLFVQYSPGNIRLMKCILLIDLILHKPKAYRHLLYNVLNQETSKQLLWKSIAGFLLLDSYRSLLLRSEEESCSSVGFFFFVSACRKVLMDVFFGNFIFFCILVLAMRILLKKSNGVSRFRDLVLGILISSYFKIFLIAMMVWEFPTSVIFIVDLFVLSSNAVALKVMTELAMNICLGVCFSAHAIKFLITQAPEFNVVKLLKSIDT
ncbi:protein arv1 homolog isoform X2 [Carica papaya]|uniref:protein arv1 homolog isoform X2 n=1 Tax=Carica papaya TaxID=3649 RepID=UPI000B8CFB3E|nr:protein arv1 homolog isoform X2 [Carica papaya]